MRWTFLLLVILLLGCGPDPDEVGGTALLGSVIYAVISGLIIHLFSRAWARIARQRTALPDAALRPADALLVLAHGAVTVAVLLLGDWVEGWLVGVGIVLTSHVSFSLVVWRILRWRPMVIVTIATVLCLAPAVPMVLMDSTTFMEFGTVMWLATGYVGGVPAFIMVVLILEAVIRQYRGGERGPDPLASEFD